MGIVLSRRAMVGGAISLFACSRGSTVLDATAASADHWTARHTGVPPRSIFVTRDHEYMDQDLFSVGSGINAAWRAAFGDSPNRGLSAFRQGEVFSFATGATIIV